ncbi:MAG: polysaccharide deacetylase family protein [Candidatus Nanoarchaeia archaeon]|jgi:peptidoglycan/xylan/chitin deacetylase (PgdA/CDA1 family)
MKLLLTSITGLLLIVLLIPPSESIVSITFDDGLESQYNASLILDEYDYKGTFYICPGLNEFEGYALMSWEQIVNLQSRGHEIGCHTMTHINASSVSDDAFRQELIDCERIINADSFAYPYGEGIDKESIVRDYFTSARLVLQGVNDKSDFNVKALIIVHDRFEQRINWLKDWLKEDGWVAVTIHGVTNNPRGLIDITPDELRQVLEVIKGSGAKVMTVRDVN